MEQTQPGGDTKPKITQKFSKYPLYSNETPTFRAQQGQKFIANGNNNDYPDYLAYLYNNSGIHNAIVTGKAAYVFGKGWKIKKGWKGDKKKLQGVMDKINAYQTLDELTRKDIFERTLYGGKFYLIEWGAFGEPISIKLQPYNTVRCNLEKTEFYVSKEWTREMSGKAKWKKPHGNKMPDDVKIYQAYNPNKRKGRQILMCADDNPASDIYPLPEYEAGKTSIETDIECGFFHLNNVKSGFSAGTMITFFNGVQENEQAQQELERDLKGKVAGTDNAGEILLNFQMPNTTEPKISPLRSNELDKQYEQLSKDVINKVLYAHRVSNGLLFGIKTPGELGGGRSEFDLAWEHFCNTYVKPKQQQEEDDINFLMTLYGILDNPLELVILDPIGIELTTENIISVLDRDTLTEMVYKKLGLEKPQVLPPAPEPAQYKSKAFAKFEEDTILSKFDAIGESADNFEIVIEGYRHDEFADTVSDEEVIKILKKNKNITVKKLADRLGISENKLYKILDRLNASNLVTVKYVEKGGDVVINTENVTPDEPADVELLSKWRYYGPKDSVNRPFCKQMLESNKLYDRAEIEGMQNDMDDFNTDVWKYKGGWYHDPVRDVNVPACRHHWQQVIVRRKKS